MKFKTFLKEGKQVGDLFHFTTVNQFKSILDDNFKMYSHNGVLSCTRNASLAQNIIGDISKKKGYVVRINIDGDRLSDKYIIKPILGYQYYLDPRIKFDIGKVPKSFEEQEEMVYDKKKDYVDIKKYVKSITFSPVTIEQVEGLKELESKIKVPYEYNRIFFRENFSETFNEDYHDLEIGIKNYDR
jgi:hypothetical protein